MPGGSHDWGKHRLIWRSATVLTALAIEIGPPPRVSASRRAAILLGAAVMLAWKHPDF